MASAVVAMPRMGSHLMLVSKTQIQRMVQGLTVKGVAPLNMASMNNPTLSPSGGREDGVSLSAPRTHKIPSSYCRRRQDAMGCFRPKETNVYQRFLSFVLISAAFLLPVHPVKAYIQAEISMKQVLAQTQFVFAAK